jgi:glycosyltransferase involved in cell wall biosynthesis
VIPPQIAIVGHDASRNPLGRALVLADLLDPLGDVRIVGFGDRVWPPARGGRSLELLRPPRTTAGLPMAAGRLRAAVRDADLIVAVKPRILSYGLAAVVRDGRPLVLDVDDLEHVFTRRRFGWLRQIVEPDREPITRLLERWHRPVAALTVASRALQRRYGGTWLPHVRDRSLLASQAREDGPRTRSMLGLDAAFVVGFVGTVRPHKGLAVLADAVGRLGGDARLLIAGDFGDGRDVDGLATRTGGRLVTATGPSMTEIGAILGACDVVAIPQSRSVEAAYQSPAKLLDALAAGRAVVTSDVGDASELLAGVGRLVAPDDATALSTALAELRDNPAMRAHLGEAALARTAEAFSLDRWRATVASVVRPLLGGVGQP